MLQTFNRARNYGVRFAGESDLSTGRERCEQTEGRMMLREVGDAEVERLRVVVDVTGNAVVRARMEPDAARGAGTRGSYENREVVAATDANNKAMHAYDAARQALE